MNYNLTDTILAISTPPGEGAIGIIRLSGSKAIEYSDQIFFGKNLTKAEANGVYYGKIKNDRNEVLDECVATIFRSPRSYTKEDIVEFSCHGSQYILKSVIQLLLSKGARLAAPGEFTMRAYLNGQLDLAQAEAVSDLISSKSSAQHEIAMNQLRGGFSKMIQAVRSGLIEFASLIELENDFGEEDVEFANRDKLIELVQTNLRTIADLISSFSYGNAIKDGIPVAIVGHPNAGKSTLLNKFLNEEKAIVSSIAGTTRDVIEDTTTINGKIFRFLDTAGLRETEDEIESIGIQRTKEQIKKASIVLLLSEIKEDFQSIVEEFKALNLEANQKCIIALTKSDLYDHTCHSYDIEESVSTLCNRTPTLLISVAIDKNIDQLKELLSNTVDGLTTGKSEVVVSSLRHYEALKNTSESLEKVLSGLSNSIPSDIIALDIRHALHHLGEISGIIQTDDLLDSIFSSFCIGK